MDQITVFSEHSSHRCTIDGWCQHPTLSSAINPRLLFILFYFSLLYLQQLFQNQKHGSGKSLSIWNTCSPMFFTVLDTKAMIWTDLRFLLPDAWIQKWWSLSLMKLVLAVKRFQVSCIEKKWIKLENIMLNKTSQTQIPYFLSYVEFRSVCLCMCLCVHTCAHFCLQTHMLDIKVDQSRREAMGSKGREQLESITGKTETSIMFSFIGLIFSNIFNNMQVCNDRKTEERNGPPRREKDSEAGWLGQIWTM